MINNNSNRRKFIGSLTAIAGASMLSPGLAMAFNATETFNVGQVIDLILAKVNITPLTRTVDQLRTGSRDQEVTGIVTTMFPTLEVIEKTAAAGANLIIAHETPFYNNNDETDWLENDDAYNFKIALLKKHGIAIWRFHDYWHRNQPDGVIMGNLKKFGWQDYFDPENPRALTLPEPMTTKAIMKLVKSSLDIPSVRLVGDLKQNCSKIYMAFGYMGSRGQIAAIQKYKPDLILSGETREWETVERVRDGRRMGEKTSIMVLSHSVSEEAGMEYAVDWIQPLVPGVQISHIPSNNPFTFH